MKRNNIISLLAGWALITLVASCGIHKKYARQDLPLPTAYRPEVKVTADTVQLPWRTFFKDPQLVALIEQALRHNSEVNVALRTLAQTELTFRQARQALLPTLDFVAGANRNWPSKNSLNGSLTEQFIGTPYMDDYATTLRLSWEVDIWGKAKLRNEGARADYFAQRENFVALRTRIIAQVAQAYYNLVSLDEQLDIAQKNTALADSTLRMMQLQFNAGQINALALEQAGAQMKTAQLLVPLAVQNITIQENTLSILCGAYPETIARAAHLDDVNPKDISATGVPVYLLSRRPDVKAAEQAVVSAQAKTGLAKVAMYPSFSLSPQAGLNSFKANTWFDLPGSITKTIALNLTQPVFQKRELRTAHQHALLEQEKAAIQFKQSVLTAVGEVSDALARNQGTSERLVLALEKKALLDQAIVDAMKLYKSGMATYLEVITAQNNKLMNDQETISIRLDRLNARTDLYRALGGGAE